MSYSLSEVRRFCSVLLFCAQPLIISALVPQTATGQTLHPLDPLTSEEVKVAAGVIAALPQFPEGSLFSTIVLKEPLKKEVLRHKSGVPVKSTGFRGDP
ncbi:MAG TPA: hypothetical protein VES69_05435 [Pyrinomonadaceae bacterium]|nr:hypothetical protein [Pyrinomonadaceae bacterium]